MRHDKCNKHKYILKMNIWSKKQLVPHFVAMIRGKNNKYQFQFFFLQQTIYDQHSFTVQPDKLKILINAIKLYKLWRFLQNGRMKFTNTGPDVNIALYTYIIT